MEFEIAIFIENLNKEAGYSEFWSLENVVLNVTVHVQHLLIGYCLKPH